MRNDDISLPDLVPVLSRGKHRNPRKGACFMEFASYLAGERWSDHPACTHPLLSSAARLVNDYTSDAGRQRLAELIPSVIGLTSDDLRVDARIALRSAAIALPVAPADRQRVLAVAVITCDRILAGLDGRPPGQLSQRNGQLLKCVPQAARWAGDFARELPASPKAFRRHGAPSIVLYAVDGIAQACIADPDALLRELLVAAIEECRTHVRTRPASGATSPAGAPVTTPAGA
jgi:hypothetical protein